MNPEGARAEAGTQTETEKGGQSGGLSPSENVDRIREILFGSQMREYSQRFAELEERLLHETNGLRGELRSRLDSLEAYTRQEIECLSDRQKAERAERTESVDRISNDLREAIRGLDRKLVQSDEQMSKDLRELRQSMLERQRNLSDEVTQCVGRMEMLQNRRLEEIRSSSMDRLALADLLTEVALRIRGEFRVPGIQDVANAGTDR